MMTPKEVQKSNLAVELKAGKKRLEEETSLSILRASTQLDSADAGPRFSNKSPRNSLLALAGCF
jgi:hypothetical protein